MSAQRWPDGTPRLGGVRCPSCQRPVDAHRPLPGTDEQALPELGAVLVCAYCATPGLLVDSLAGPRWRPMTPAERAADEAVLAPLLEQVRRRAPLWRAVERERM